MLDETVMKEFEWYLKKEVEKEHPIVYRERFAIDAVIEKGYIHLADSILDACSLFLMVINAHKPIKLTHCKYRLGILKELYEATSSLHVDTRFRAVFAYYSAIGYHVLLSADRDHTLFVFEDGKPFLMIDCIAEKYMIDGRCDHIKNIRTPTSEDLT